MKNCKQKPVTPNNQWCYAQPGKYLATRRNGFDNGRRNRRGLVTRLYTMVKTAISYIIAL